MQVQSCIRIAYGYPQHKQTNIRTEYQSDPATNKAVTRFLRSRLPDLSPQQLLELAQSLASYPGTTPDLKLGWRECRLLQDLVLDHAIPRWENSLCSITSAAPEPVTETAAAAREPVTLYSSTLMPTSAAQKPSLPTSALAGAEKPSVTVTNSAAEVSLTVTNFTAETPSSAANLAAATPLVISNSAASWTGVVTRWDEFTNLETRLQLLGRLLSRIRERDGDGASQKGYSSWVNRGTIVQRHKGLYICTANDGASITLAGFCVVEEVDHHKTIHLIESFLPQGSGVGSALVLDVAKEKGHTLAYNCIPGTEGFWRKIGKCCAGGRGLRSGFWFTLRSLVFRQKLGERLHVCCILRGCQA